MRSFPHVMAGAGRMGVIELALIVLNARPRAVNRGMSIVIAPPRPQVATNPSLRALRAALRTLR